MKTLILPVKKKWFDQIKARTKRLEYRLNNEYWRKRLVNKHYDQLVITLGYPKRDDHDRRITFPYRGYVPVSLVHEEWNNVRKDVFAIKLESE